MNFPIMDSQKALSFLMPQLTHIERTVYQIKYAPIRYHEIVPVDTTANPWTPSVTYFSSDAVGTAAWFNPGSQDVPHADVVRSKYQTGVKTAAIGYSWDVEEIQQAMMLGIPLAADKASTCRRIAEEFIDQRALFGDTSVGSDFATGLVNNAAVTAGTFPATGSGSSTLWANKTPAQVLSDVNGILTGIWTGSNTVEIADTMLISPANFALLVTTPFNAYSEKTLYQYIMEANIFTATTGRQLKIVSVRGLETAGAGSVSRTVAYRRDPDVVKMHLPMPFRFLPVWQKGPLLYEVPGIFRFGGVDVRLPAAFRYGDGA